MFFMFSLTETWLQSVTSAVTVSNKLSTLAMLPGSRIFSSRARSLLIKHKSITISKSRAQITSKLLIDWTRAWLINASSITEQQNNRFRFICRELTHPLNFGLCEHYCVPVLSIRIQSRHLVINIDAVCTSLTNLHCCTFARFPISSKLHAFWQNN